MDEKEMQALEAEMRRLLDGHIPERAGIQERPEIIKDVERRQEAEAYAQHRRFVEAAGWIVALAMLWALLRGWAP
jgi:hypothetical protein